MVNLSRRKFLHACASTAAYIGIAGPVSAAVSWRECSGSLRYPQTRFAVLPDPHFYDPELGMESPSFREIMMDEIKLFNLGEALLERTLEKIANSRVDFLLIPGDLTKDGELESHNKFAAHLEKLQEKGVQIFVVPGNHDINNPRSFSYNIDGPLPTETVSPEKFARIYRKFGYESALFRDTDSLSYVVEPVRGLWVLGVDSCRYEENLNVSDPGGEIKPCTLEWIKEIMEKSKDEGKAVIGFMHHAVLENFKGHALLLPDYLINDHEFTSRFLAESGLQMIFTGHTHVQDITGQRWGRSKSLLDIQTGSIVTYPHPFRIVTLRHEFAHIKSDFIKDLPGVFQPGVFYENSKNFSKTSAERLAASFGLRGSLQDLSVKTYLAHVQGDEKPSEQILEAISELKSSLWPWRRAFGTFLSAIWNDPKPADNDLLIYLPYQGTPLSSLMQNTLDILCMTKNP